MALELLMSCYRICSGELMLMGFRLRMLSSPLPEGLVLVFRGLILAESEYIEFSCADITFSRFTRDRVLLSDVFNRSMVGDVFMLRMSFGCQAFLSVDIPR